MPHADRELVEACCQGDARAWRELVDRFAPLGCHLLRRTLTQRGYRPSNEEIDDLCAELFTELVEQDYRRLRAYDPTYTLSTYLGLIARSRAIDYWRRRIIEPRRATLDPADVAGAAGPAASNPEDGADDLGANLNAAMEGLSPRERMIVQLFYFGGKKYREIAETLGIPLNTVCSTLCRALEKLRKRMGDRMTD